MHVPVLGPKVTPLEAVDGPQVHLLARAQPNRVQIRTRAVAVPNMDPLVLQHLRVSAASHEPQELLGHAPPEHALGREDGKCVAKVEPHRGAELGKRAGARAIAPKCARVDHIADQVQVLGGGEWAGWSEGREGGRVNSQRRTRARDSAALSPPHTHLMLLVPRVDGGRQGRRRLAVAARVAEEVEAEARVPVTVGEGGGPHFEAGGVDLGEERVARSVGLHERVVQRLAVIGGQALGVDLREEGVAEGKDARGSFRYAFERGD